MKRADEMRLRGEAAMHIKRVGLKKQMYDEAGSLALAKNGF
ncbi:hypothetical protein RA166_00490 [Mycetohabitans endofungorum]|nr:MULTISPECIES: hypothetical protein [Burkholderiaceae]